MAEQPELPASSGSSSPKLDDILAYYLKDNFNKEGNIIGHFEDLETFNIITMKMKDRGYTFSVRDSDVRKKKTKSGEADRTEDDIDPGLNTVFYNLKAMSIKFFGLPFTVEKTTHYQCTYGCKYYKSKAGKTRRADDPGHLLPVKKRRNVISKKMGCLAKMTLKKITVYPDYALSALKDWRKKKKLIESLRKDLTMKVSEVRKSYRYYLSVSMQSRHNHPPIVRDVVVPTKPKRAHSDSFHRSEKKKKEAEDDGNWITICPQVKVTSEEESMQLKFEEAQDATFFNSLVKFPAGTLTCSEMKPINVDVSTFQVQEEVRTYQFETIQYPTAQELQILFKEKLKRLYTLSENCNNTSLLLRLVADLEQADQALVNDIGYDPTL